MPLASPALTSVLASQIVAAGCIGMDVPKLANGIAIGVCQFLTVQSKVTSIDTGLLGVGTSIMPLLVPSPLIQSSLMAAFPSAQIIGIRAPQLILGLTNGLAAGFASLALMQIAHPGIGVGTGVARVVGGTAIPAMIAGFAAASMVGDGPVKMARAMGTALDTIFASYIQPVVIAGSPSIVGGAGVGLGVVI